MSELLVLLCVLVAALVARRAPMPDIAALGRLLDARWAPAVIGAIAALAIGAVWGSLAPLPLVQDEAAYLLQAEIFARLRWAGAARPLPDFFEQMAVFGEPALIPKYPPGHAILLVPGVWLGMPALVPLLLNGLAAAALFALARRVAGGWVALLTCAVWLTAPGNLQWRASYLSQTTTSAAWLVGWWCLLAWRDRGGAHWAAGVAGCVGWCAITRPITAIAFAIPVAVAMLVIATRRRAWRELTLAAATGAAVLAIVPVWSARTIGDWTTTPYTRYMRTYIPTERLGFGLVGDVAERRLPPDLARVDADWRRVHALHTVERLPATTLWRTVAVARGTWGGWRLALILFFVAGLAAVGGVGAFALATVLLLFAAHLPFAHPALWWPYYLEALPVLAFVTAIGVWRVLVRLIESRQGNGDPQPARPAFAAAALAIGALALSVADVASAHGVAAHGRARQETFARRLAAIPDSAAVVFVRYGPSHDHHRSLITNGPDLARQRVWIVYDRGAENDRLRRLAPSRVAYLYDEATDGLYRLDAERSS